MKVFVFDLLPYGEELDRFKKPGDPYLPYPLGKSAFDGAVAARTYAEHLDAWEELDRLGYDGVGFNEHHTSPYGLMTSPNLMAAAAAQRTRNLKLLIYGNLLPLHNPVRLAEELAMLDCMSNGRLIAGFARGIPREHDVFGIPQSESRARFDEAFEIIEKAWTEESFSHQGRFWSFKDLSIWPRPMQQPRPPVWIPVTGSKESVEWAARHDVPITPGIGYRALMDDIIRYYARCLAANGRRITPDHLSVPANVYLADSKAQAVKETGPHLIYFQRSLFTHGNITNEVEHNRATGYLSAQANDFQSKETREATARARAANRNLTIEDVARSAEHLPWGTADEVIERVTTLADQTGAATVLVSMNRGAMPHEMFMNQIRRFAREVLPALKAHQVTRVPLAEEAAAAQ